MDPNITIEDSDHSDEEAITAQKVFEILELAWLNERSAPELLPEKVRSKKKKKIPFC